MNGKGEILGGHREGIGFCLHNLFLNLFLCANTSFVSLCSQSLRHVSNPTILLRQTIAMAAPMSPEMLASLPHDNKGYKAAVATAIAFALATFGIIGRFVARFLCRKRLELNDYFIILAYVCLVPATLA